MVWGLTNGIEKRKSPFTLFFLSIILMVLAAPAGTCAPSGDWPVTGLFTEYTWMEPPEHGWLVQELDLRRGNPVESLGAVGIGNGVAFALMGLEMPQNAMSNIIGPGYETNESFFGPVWHELVKVDDAGQVTDTITFTRSRLYRVPGTMLVLVQEANEDYVLSTITYSYQFASIVRVVHIEDLRDAGTDCLRILLRKKSVQEGKPLQGSQFGDVDQNQREISYFSYDETGPAPVEILDHATALVRLESYEHDGLKFGAYQLQFRHPESRFPPGE